MKTWVLILPMVVLISACAQLPRISALPFDDASTLNCDQVFPAGRWQFHHLIQATVGGRPMGRLTGVSVVSIPAGTIECALMTMEGLVLFSARYDGRLTVTRATAPFDRPGFAEGLMADLRLLYYKPEAPLQAHGQLVDGARVCRYISPGGVVTDVVVKDPHHWAIHAYSTHKRRLRTIEAAGSLAGNGPARELTIQSHGLIEYDLELKLIEAVSLDEE